MMHQKKNNRIYLHLTLALCACLIAVLTAVSGRKLLGESVPSEYYADLKMPESSESILDKVTMTTYHSYVEGTHVYADGKDARLMLSFADGENKKFCSVEVKLAESFPYDTPCVLYYPRRSGKYVEERKDVFTLKKGETSIYFSLPVKILKHGLNEFRIDIDDDYVIEDILVSDQEIAGTYSAQNFYSSWSVAFYAVLLFVFLEAIYCLRKRIACVAHNIWKKRKNITAWMLLMIGSAAAADLLAWLVFRMTGKDFNGFWALLIALCAAVTAAEVGLLGKMVPAPPKAEKRKGDIWTKVLLWGGVVIFCLLTGFQWVDALGRTPELEGRARFAFPLIFAAVQAVMMVLLYQKYAVNVQEGQISFLNLYTFAMLLIGMGYMLTFLPYIAPDEPSHYLSAYRISNMLLGKMGQPGSERLLVRMEDYLLYLNHQEELSAQYYTQTISAVTVLAKNSGYMVIDAPMVTNSIFSYFTTAIGITAARLLHLDGVLTFYAGRFANLLFFVWAMRCLIKKIPFGKTALFAVCMMPLTIHTAATCSYDVTTFVLVALFVVQMMCMLAEPGKISRREYVKCVFFGALMAPSKLVYMPLLFLVFLIPDEKLGEDRKEAWKKKLIVVGTGILATFVIMLAISMVSADAAIREMMEENASVNMLTWTHEPGYTISWILKHPGEYILMVVRTFFNMTDYYFFTMVGSSLGWLNVNLPHLYSVFSFCMVLAAANIRDGKEDKAQIGTGGKLWIILLCAGSMLCTLLSMTLNWTPMSYDYIMGVQGRYFLPLLLPALWLFRTKVVEVGSVMRQRIVLLTTMFNIWALVYIFAHAVISG